MLCGRACGVDRTKELGYCKMSDKLYLARAALHYWEEPPISGDRGSGTIFFSGCSLRCVYCQNREISRGESGREVSLERLSEIMHELSIKGAHNINLVTPTHFVPSIKKAIILAKSRGLDIPIVYNTSSFDSVDALRSLSGLVDIYLADMKYYLGKTAKKLSFAENYPEVARLAIEEMVKQTGECVIDSCGIMKKGVIVRLLLLPGHLAEAKLCLKYLFDRYGDSIYISLMSQYTPRDDLPSPLNRRVTKREYLELCEYAEKLGVKNGFTQEAESAEESFIPPFDNTGI